MKASSESGLWAMEISIGTAGGLADDSGCLGAHDGRNPFGNKMTDDSS